VLAFQFLLRIPQPPGLISAIFRECLPFNSFSGFHGKGEVQRKPPAQPGLSIPSPDSTGGGDGSKGGHEL